MYCNKCGNEINDNERFCKFCGASVEEMDEPTEHGELNELSQKQAKKKLKCFMLILAMVLVLVIAMEIVLLMNDGQSDSTDDQDDWKVVEEEESQNAETESPSENVTENISTEEETLVKQEENISDEPEQEEAPEIRMRDVEDVTASSYLSEKNIKHVPDLIMDGDTTTAWVEGVDGNGEGESITFTFGDLYAVSDIKIWNGYQKSEDLYYKNARPAELELEFLDGSTERISLQDTSSGFQEFALERHVTSYVKVKIISTYEGSKYEDTVISEIELQ